MTAQRPAGTVYGRGGVDVREPRRVLHPVVLALVVVAAITAVLALGYWAFFRSPVDPRPAAAPAAATSAVPSAVRPAASPSTTAASPSPTPAATFGTGRMVLVLAADPRATLVADGDFAAMSADDTMVLTVVRGLADSRCFTLRAGDGRYLRHFDFRLRFDPLDDSDLFRNDATFCPVQGRPAGTVRLRSKNYPDRLLHRRDARLYIDEPDSSRAFDRDSSFAVRRG